MAKMIFDYEKLKAAMKDARASDIVSAIHEVLPSELVEITDMLNQDIEYEGDFGDE
jgi:hypothetical protein